MSADVENEDLERGEGERGGEAPEATSVLERERRQGLVAGAAGLASVVAVFVALALALVANDGRGRIPPPDAGTPQNGVDSGIRLVQFARHQGEQAIATGARAAGLLAVVVLGLYLYRLVRAREPALHEYGRWLAILGPVTVAVATVFAYFVLSGLAYDFVISGTQNPAQASLLMSESAGLKVATILDVVSRLALAAWMAVASLDLMRVGLLTRFLAYFGIGSAGALVILPPTGEAMFVGWVASLAILALGWWPGGRPPAWRTLKPQPIETL